MKFIIFNLLICTFLNAEIVIVTNKDSQLSNLNKQDVKYLYLAKVKEIGNIKIRPILLNDKSVHNEFLNKILEKTPEQFNSYWARMIFTGKESSLERVDEDDIEKELDILNTIICIDSKNIKNKWKIIYKN